MSDEFLKNMSQEKRALLLLERARVYMMYNQPFFSYLAMHLRFKASDKLPTCGVDQSANFFYNVDYICGLPDDEVPMVMCHEVMHLAMGHFDRFEAMKKVEPQIDRMSANVCMDMAINPLIFESFNYQVSDWLVAEGEFEGMAWEEIYHKMPKTVVNRVGNNGDGDSDSGDDDGNGKYRSPGNGDYHFTDQKDTDDGKISNDEQPGNDGNGSGSKPGQNSDGIDWKYTVALAAQHAKQMGKLPAGLAKFVDHALEPPRFNWTQMLERFVSSSVPSDYTWARKSKRSYPCGVYLPHTRNESVDLCIGIDTSGSVSDEEYVSFLSEILGMADAFNRAIRMNIMLCDAKVHTALVGEVDIDIIIEKVRERRGYGGTSFTPVMEYIEEHDIDCKVLIYLTDGYGNGPDEPTPYPTMWIVSADGASEGDNYWDGLEKSGTVIKME